MRKILLIQKNVIVVIFVVLFMVVFVVVSVVFFVVVFVIMFIVTNGNNPKIGSIWVILGTNFQSAFQIL